MFAYAIISLAIIIFLVSTMTSVISFSLERKRKIKRHEIVTSLKVLVPGKGWVNADKYQGLYG